MENAKVSIIIPNYNKGRLVRHSLDSLARQTCKEWEAVVVDDCSSDESWAIIQSYAARDARIVAVRNEANKGGNYCRNLGVKMSKGRYLVFLDSDDWLADDCLEVRISEFERGENSKVDMLIFDMATIKDGNVGGKWRYGDRENALISFLRHEIPWSIMMPIWRKETFERIGGFDEAFPRLQDVELHTRALLMGVKYKSSERVEPDCFYYVDASRVATSHDKIVTNAIEGMILYSKKMSELIDGSKNYKALQETAMAAIRAVGDNYQMGWINKTVRDNLEARINSALDIGTWLKFYAFCYRMRVNKVHGFNKFFKLLFRACSKG